MNFNKLKHKIKNGFSKIFRVLLLLISSFLIIYFFPKSGKFKYNFENGRPWQTENFYSPFDFDVIKTDEEIDLEKKEITLNTFIYFEIDSLFDIRSIEKELDYKIDDLTANPALNKLRKRDIEEIKFHSMEIIKDIYKVGYFKEDIFYDKSQKVYILFKNKVKREATFGSLIKKEDLWLFVNNKIIEYDYLKFKTQLQLLIPKVVKPNLSYKKISSEGALSDATRYLSKKWKTIKKGELIITKGVIVENEKLRILESLKKEYQSNNFSSSNSLLINSAYSLLVIVSILVIFFFLRKFERSIFKNNRKISFVFFNITLIILITTWVVDINSDYIYVIPLCIIPLLFKAFFDSRIAFFIHSVTIMLLGFIVPNSYEFIFLNIIAGIVTILTSENIYKRANLFLAVTQITLVYILAYVSFYIIQEGSFENLELQNFALFMLCGLLTLFIYPLIYIYEKIFTLVSDVSLLELSDTNSKILKELSNKAPGTFHHSLNVANLAEACADKIGANILLSRVGALHHDIGKIKDSSFFIENQVSEFNPHNKLSPIESVNIIKGHVEYGVKLAKKYRLPERIIDFIKTHHGTNLISFFYHSAQNESNTINKSDFCYDGPKPFSKETAIVMMCDSVEAATKSLTNPDNTKIDDFVEKIIDKQIEAEQFVDCELTFKNISVIKYILKEKLKNIYHIRIEYPDDNN
tara:strand:+ start:1971 stop:4049 length:2079 start_codon:yes stop_codon:yes gene_type:complete